MLPRVGFEIELLAPRGSSRRDLALAVAHSIGGRVRTTFHRDTEPSRVPGRPIFHNLTPGFAVEDREGAWFASFVDDLTLQDDLDRQAPPLPGWWRIVGDDRRLLTLVSRHVDPNATQQAALEPIAALFGTELQHDEGGLVKVVDEDGIAVALAATVPGERERPCEVITAPVASDHGATLHTLLCLARELGFTVPAEAALHLHFDAAPLRSAAAVANLVHLWDRLGGALKAWVGTNPRCRRLGPLDASLRAAVGSPGFADRDWADAAGELSTLGVSKFRDLNLRNLVHGLRNKPTVEVRILPVWLDAEPILAATGVFAALLERATQPAPVGPGAPVPPGPASDQAVAAWLGLDALPELAPPVRSTTGRYRSR